MASSQHSMPLAEQRQLEYALYLLEAAMQKDDARKWWQQPERLWRGRVEHAATILRRIVG